MRGGKPEKRGILKEIETEIEKPFVKALAKGREHRLFLLKTALKEYKKALRRKSDWYLKKLLRDEISKTKKEIEKEEKGLRHWRYKLDKLA